MIPGVDHRWRGDLRAVWCDTCGTECTPLSGRPCPCHDHPQEEQLVITFD